MAISEPIGRKVTFAEAARAIEQERLAYVMWMVRANSLLRIAAKKPGVISENFAQMCQECVQEMP